MRVKFLFVLFASLFAVVLFRLFTIQVVRHQNYAVLAQSQHRDYINIPAARGAVFFRDGTPLAENQITYLLYAEPQKVASREEAARKLADEIYPEESRRTEFVRLLNILKQDLQWVPLAHNLSVEVKKTIEEQKIAGIGFDIEPVRFYPEEDLARELLGFVGKNKQGSEQGYYGLEGYYDGDLKGRPGMLFAEKSASGNPIPIGSFKRIEAVNGRDLALTIDRSVQFLVESRLADAVGRFGAKGGSVIVVDPRDGAILAMADYVKSEEEEERAEEKEEEKEEKKDQEEETFPKNLSIAETYEPGSVLKVLTMSAAIDSGSVTPQTAFDDTGPLIVGGFKVDNWNGRHHGNETMIQVLQNSCNIGASFVAQKLGSKTLREYFVKFGLGTLTGIDLEGEDTGIVKEVNDWRAVDLVTASFGQGVSVTPLQLITIFSAIANGGVLDQPYVASLIIDGDKKIDMRPKKGRRVVSEKTAAIMVDMLTQAVEGGESKFYNLKSHKVAGKTGTAQIPVGGAYDPRKTNATFVGFLPSHPGFVMLTLLREPSSSVYAAETAVPLWMEIAKELAVYYGIPPDK